MSKTENTDQAVAGRLQPVLHPLDSLKVLLLRSLEDDDTFTRPQLQQDALVEAQDGQKAAVVSLATL